MKYNIGTVKPKNRLVLAPMAGVTDIAFRIICKEFGAGLIYTEMVNANAVVRSNKATLKKFLFSDFEKPIVVQLFGSRTKVLTEAAVLIEEAGADIIDLNLGCPDRKVMGQGAGAALLKRPAKIAEIISSLVSKVKIPVTAKIRTGFTDTTKEHVKTAKIVEEAGASAVAVHGRTVNQGYSGKADWNAIKEVKAAIDIPVLGSGDIFLGIDAKKMIDETKCDFAMIGRGAMTNPFIFRQANEVLEGKDQSESSPIEKLDLIERYIHLAKENDIYKFPGMKRHALDFTKGITNSVRLREKMAIAKDEDEIRQLVEEFKKTIIY